MRCISDRSSRWRSCRSSSANSMRRSVFHMPTSRTTATEWAKFRADHLPVARCTKAFSLATGQLNSFVSTAPAMTRTLQLSFGERKPPTSTDLNDPRSAGVGLGPVPWPPTEVRGAGGACTEARRRVASCCEVPSRIPWASRAHKPTDRNGLTRSRPPWFVDMMVTIHWIHPTDHSWGFRRRVPRGQPSNRSAGVGGNVRMMRRQSTERATRTVRESGCAVLGRRSPESRGTPALGVD
jgi:hypothetical protein